MTTPTPASEQMVPCPCIHPCGPGEVCGKCRCHGDALDRAFGRPDSAAELRVIHGFARDCDASRLEHGGLAAAAVKGELL